MMGQLVERQVHMHIGPYGGMTPEDIRKIEQTLNKQCAYFLKLKAEVEPIIRANMERSIYEGAAALPTPAADEVPDYGTGPPDGWRR